MLLSQIFNKSTRGPAFSEARLLQTAADSPKAIEQLPIVKQFPVRLGALDDEFPSPVHGERDRPPG